MKKLLLTLLLAAGITQAQVKIGTNPTTLGASSLLELENTNKALLITRVANTGVIASPVNGMIIYDLSVNCFKGYQNGAWTDCGFLFVSTSSNGSALVSAYSCSTATAGTLTMGVPVSGVTQTITATVTTVGTYNIVTPTVNGVYFAASGTFAGTGAQNIVLTATGTPTAAGTNSFTLNTTPSCTFTRAILDNSTNGSGVVSAYNCSTATAGTLTMGVPVSGVTQTITATVTTVGTYNIVTPTVNGVTFAASGTFAATGAQNIVLTATGTPTAAGANSFTLNTTPNCSFSRTTVIPVVALPANITLSSISPYFIASVFDVDYTPYSAPTSTATLATAVAAGGGNEPTTVNVQGTLTTTGVSINIPYTVTGSSVSLPAFSQTITIPAAYTEDGISRDIMFSYSTATLAVGTGKITATLKSVGGTLNAKKLDVQTGIGSDAMGWLLGQFMYATNNAGGTAPFQVRDIAGIPDRNIADANHLMLYLPVTAEDGKVWLNNNLGADYSNITKSSFNLAQQATSELDYKAYGSIFQWGRKPDGHELINWSSSTAGNPVYGFTTTRNDNPTDNLFIQSDVPVNFFDWRINADISLWSTEASANNPCPVGFRVPSIAELNTLAVAMGLPATYTGSPTNTTQAWNSLMRFTVPGARNYNQNVMSATGSTGVTGQYYSSTSYNDGTSGGAVNRFFSTQYSSTSQNNYRRLGMSVRCIKD